MRELMDNEQGGSEYETYYADIKARYRAEWWEETEGRISFHDWLDGEKEGED